MLVARIAQVRALSHIVPPTTHGNAALHTTRQHDTTERHGPGSLPRPSRIELRPLQQKLCTLSAAARGSQLDETPRVLLKGCIRNYGKKELHLIYEASGLLTVQPVLSTSIEVGQPNESIRATERH
jgi:hypothetical protein